MCEIEHIIFSYELRAVSFLICKLDKLIFALELKLFSIQIFKLQKVYFWFSAIFIADKIENEMVIIY